MDISLYLRLEPLVSNGMSVFQMDNFVINDHITPYRKLRQAVIESKGRLETIASYELDLEELDVKQQQALFDRDSAESTFTKQLKDIERRRFSFEINRKQALIAQLKQESEFFLNVIDTLVDSEFGGADSVVEQLQNHEFRNNSESDYWTKKLARTVYSDYINYGTITKGVLESISCLSEEQRNLIIQQATEQQIDFNMLLRTVTDQTLVSKD